MKAILNFFRELFIWSPEEIELKNWLEKQDADTRAEILSVLTEQFWDDLKKWWRR